MVKIYNSNSNTLVSGTSKSDSIESHKGDYVTISSGAGNDIIRNYQGDHVTISGGEGNDSIKNSYGEDVTISGGNGTDTIFDYKGEFVTIFGGDGNDTILGYKEDWVTIFGGNGNDYINSKKGDFVSLYGGTGKDTIVNFEGYAAIVDGGAENDFIIDVGMGSEINGGKGNDKITLSEYGIDAEYAHIKYSSGDGNDTIFGFNSSDTLHITKGKYKTSISGNDVIVKVGKGKITLKDAVGEKISIENSEGNVTTKTFSSSSANLFEDNNFVTKDNLSELIAEKSVGEFEFDRREKISQENLITFAEK